MQWYYYYYQYASECCGIRGFSNSVQGSAGGYLMFSNSVLLRAVGLGLFSNSVYLSATAFKTICQQCVIECNYI